MEPKPNAQRSRFAWLRRQSERFTAGDPIVALVCLLVLAYYIASPGVFEGKASGDGLITFFYLPGLVYHHTFDMAAPGGAQWTRILGREVTGHVANLWPVGPILWWMPFYLVGLLFKGIASLFVTLPVEKLPGQTPYDFWMAALGSVAAGLLAAARTFRLLSRKLGIPAARFGVFGAVLATPLFWYLTNQPLYQHACAFWAVTLLVERTDAWRAELDWRRTAALGAMGGLAMLMRLQEGVWLLVPGLEVLRGLVHTLRSVDRTARGKRILAWLGKGVLLAVMAAVVFSPQLVLWHYYFGQVHPPQPPGHMRWYNPALLAMLFSTRGGLIPWAPLLYLVVPGLLAARRPLGGLASRLGLMLLVELWVNASAWEHWASWTFGARRFTDASVTFAAGLAGVYWAIERVGDVPTRARLSRRASRILWGVAVLAVLYNGLLMELVRQRRVKSSGAGAYPASVWVKWAKGPKWLEHLLDRTGYPFVQPLGWLYAWWYDAPVTAFEGVIGNYMLERDWRVHQLVHVRRMLFAEAPSYFVEGVQPKPTDRDWPRDTLVPATGPRLRVLVPMVAQEPIDVQLTGEFGGKEREMTVHWNTTPLVPVQAERGVLRFHVPKEIVYTRARTNEILIDHVPPGSRYRGLDFDGKTPWWEE